MVEIGKLYWLKKGLWERHTTLRQSLKFMMCNKSSYDDIELYNLKFSKF